MKKLLTKKPWGHELILEKNSKYVVKKIFMKKGKRCSLQFHNFKVETLYIVSGKLRVLFGKSNKKIKKKVFKKNDFITLRPKIIHRMEAITNSTYIEASTPQLKDVIRIKDDYNRI